jgi:hypothetical protein
LSFSQDEVHHVQEEFLKLFYRVLSNDSCGAALRRAFGRSMIAFLNRDKKITASMDVVKTLQGILANGKDSAKM